MAQVATDAEAWYNEPQQADEPEYEVEHEQDDHQPNSQHQQQPTPHADESKEQPNEQSDSQSPPPTALASNHPRYHQQHQHHPNPPHTPSAAPAAFDVSSLDACAHAAIESDDEAVVSQFLQLLEQHREECERKSMYVEAELAKKKIEELRQQYVRQTSRGNANVR
jgi:hypothetical protein